MNTVRTPGRTRRNPASPQVPQKQRPFELQDCPAFYPTQEEFKDPMSYIRAITPQAQEFGIAKIVPPETWRMPFVTDTEVSKNFIYSFVIEVPKGGRKELIGRCF
jgi:histone demethylase JARID1